MLEVIQSILALIIVLGLLITFHEFGHFWVARRCGVKIMRFSIGFGQPLYKRYFGRDRSEFVIAALPLGGYVKMLDEREGEVREDELPRAFNRKPLAQRTLIVLAGPVFNFIFAICAYWLIFTIGVDSSKPIIGAIASDSAAQRAGFQSGDQIISMNDTHTPTWLSVIDMVVKKVVNGERVTLNVVGRNQVTRSIELDLSEISVDDMSDGRILEEIGLTVYRPPIPAVIGEVLEGGAAQRDGLQPGDKIITVDDKVISTWDEWVDIVRMNPGSSLDIQVMRQDTPIHLFVTPDSLGNTAGYETGRIGASVKYPHDLYDSLLATESYSVHRALYKSLIKTWEMCILTLKVLGKILVGEASVKNLSGPISIAQYAGQSAEIGLVAFLGFLAIVSISLGVLNLLPVPLLDGGHLMYYFMEFLSGKAVSESVQLAGQKIGSVLLVGLMGLVIFNDFVRLMS